MATIFSSSTTFASLSPSSSATPPKHSQNALLSLTTKAHIIPQTSPKISATPTAKPPSIATATIAAAAAILLASPAPLWAEQPAAFQVYYGTAASAANYGGYGGNSDKKASAEYVYDVPEGWKERLVSKVEKGTNGTDSEFYNPKKKSEKEYLTFLSGFRELAPRDTVLNNLALSDVDLQDLISTAENVRSEEKKDKNGQLYYTYEVDGVGAHGLISVTCANNKLYAHFVKAPTPEWNRDQETLKHLHESFKTVGSF